MRLFLFLLTGLAVAICFPCLDAARADGIIVSERALKPLEIPRQTGVILHSQGKETLTIWNTVQADSSPMAWVLPLPDVPDVIQETDPAAVRLVQLAAAPRMRISGRFGWDDWSFAGLVLLVAVAAFLARRTENSSKHAPGILFGVFLGWMLYAASKASYGSAIPTEQLITPGGPTIEAVQDTGSYETTVIRGDSTGQLNPWLTANGFAAFTGLEARVAESYIDRKWVFLCAKLKTSPSGLTEVRPLTVRFASQQAVYPMSLTQGAGTVPVDLYVVGRERMHGPTGRLERVNDAPTSFWSGFRQDWNLSEALFALSEAEFQSEKTKREAFGFPASRAGAIPPIPPGRDVLLDGLMADPPTWISHLSGIFTPTSDWADISLVPTDMKIEPVRYRTRKAWMMESLESIYGILAMLAFLLTALFAMSTGSPGKRPGWQWPVAACLLALGLWALGLHKGAAHTIFIQESQLADAVPGSPGSVAGLLDAWIRSFTTPPLEKDSG